ncbi:ATP-binding protein [Acidobacteriota bacterium]
MRFLDRTREINQLDSLWDSGRKELLILYGRRRLGKTTLLREFARKRSSLFFSCPIATSNEALRIFQARMADVLREPLLASTRFPGWFEALDYAFSVCAERKMPLILDEFPYLLRSVKGIDSLIQNLWDQMTDPLWLCLSGSILSVMRDKILGSDAPLYGRRTAQIALKPMSFRDVSIFYGNCSFETQAIFYAIFGGVPAYAERAAVFRNPEEATVQLILDPNAVLYQEPDFLVREELREPIPYFSILHGLSRGRTRPHQISLAAGVPHSGVNKYLDTLCRMNLVERRVPVTELRPERSTKAIYRIVDPFIRFWFRYVYSHRSSIELQRGQVLYQKTIDPDLDNLMGVVFEEICKQELQRNGAGILGWDPFRIGAYWQASTEIDLVAEDVERRKVAFVECKWSKKIHIDRLLTELRKKADSIKTYRGCEKSFYIMSRSRLSHPAHIHVGKTTKK